MAILNKALNCLAILMAALMFAGLYDVGHLGLAEMLAPWAIGPIVVFVICSMVPVFVGAKGADAEVLDEEGLTAKIDEVHSKATSRIAALQTSLDGLSGQDNEALLEENKALKEQLEAIQQAERDKVLSEAEQLRSKNEELEKQIKQWAIETVGGTVAQDAAA